MKIDNITNKMIEEKKGDFENIISQTTNGDVLTELVFDDVSSNFCVCMLDIVDSTAITSSLYLLNKVCQFYSLFINSLSPIINQFHGKVIRTGGDSLIYYFPETADIANIEAFKRVLECSMTLLDIRHVLNTSYAKLDIKPISYRISAEYGPVESAKSGFSRSKDLFGPPLGLCAKINNKAKPNSMVIGSNLHQVLRKMNVFDKDYKFKETSISVGLNQQKYPIFHITSTVKLDQVRYEKLKAALSHQALRQKRSHRSYEQEVVRKEECNGEKLQPLCASSSSSSSSQSSPSLSSISTEASEGRPLNIMIVDDEPDCLLTYQSFLEKEGYTIHSFFDSGLAVKGFAQHHDPVNQLKFDLVVLDIRMPRLNGLQLYHRLKAIDSKIRVLFVTALDASNEIMTLLPDVRTSEIIVKPVTCERFIKSVKMAAVL
jgi:CheY-like chemotaxis protein/class 3 adenylate cyclase